MYVHEEVIRRTEWGKSIFVTGTVEDFVRTGQAEHLAEVAGVEENDARFFDSRTVSARWSYSESYDAASQLALNGWSEGVQRLTDLRDDLMAELGPLLPEPVTMHDVEGFDVDVANFVAGEPESMINTIDLDEGHRQIRVLVNISSSAMKSPESMMMRGLLAAGIVDSLEHMGHRVTLDAVSIHSDTDTIAMLANVKQASQVLDVERMVFAVAHPSMLRRINFGVMEARPKAARRRIGVPGGYGVPNNDYKRHVPEDYWPDIYIGNANTASNLKEVRDSVINNLREVGVLRE